MISKFKAFYKTKWNKKPYPSKLRKSSSYKGNMSAGYATRTLKNAMSSRGLLKRARERIARKRLIRKMNMVRTILGKTNRKRKGSNQWTNTPRSKLRATMSYNDNVVRSIADYL